MRSLSEMSSEIVAVAERLFAESAQSLLKPMIEGEKRFLSSDICIRMARRRGQDPAVLARELLASIEPVAGETWVQHAGYLNITIARYDSERLEAPMGGDDLRNVTIFIASKPASASQEAMLRLSAPAVLQGWLLAKNRRKVKVILGNQVLEPGRFATLPDFWEAILNFAGTERGVGISVHDQVLDVWRQHRTSQCCFSLFPGDVEHTLWREGGREPGFDERVSVFIPDRGWLADIDRYPGSSVIFRDRSQDCLSLILHLCSGSRGVDIEWQSPRFFERKNMLWYLASTHQRLINLLSAVPRGDSGVVEISPEIGFLIRFQPEFYLWALRAGEVVQWVTATGTLLERISALLNDPSMRIEARTGELPLARLCPLLEDATSKIYSFFHVD